MKHMKNVTIYTDGCCKKNPGMGSWAAILLYQDAKGKLHKKQIAGKSIEITTNNRMELTAVIESLKHLKYKCDVTVISDSTYVDQHMLSIAQINSM